MVLFYATWLIRVNSKKRVKTSALKSKNAVFIGIPCFQAKIKFTSYALMKIGGLLRPPMHCP